MEAGDAEDADDWEKAASAGAAVDGVGGGDIGAGVPPEPGEKLAEAVAAPRPVGKAGGGGAIESAASALGAADAGKQQTSSCSQQSFRLFRILSY